MNEPTNPPRRKLIEVDLPLDEINRESAREKSIRHGHPSTLHLWWARRPLAACRAVIFASLVDDPADCSDEFPTEDAQRAERKRLHQIIKELVKWENSNNPNILAEARYEIARCVARSHNEPAPDPTRPDLVLDYLKRQAKPIYDPFCGGGSIPLEAQRLGLQAVGSDLNPVAALITKALIELPPQFANQPPVNPDASPMGLTIGKGKNAEQVPWRGAAGLADDVRYYGSKMREMAEQQIGHLYPKAQLPDGKEATVVAWLWARTVPCPNPACGIAMPLLTTFQASKKPGNEHWMEPNVDRYSKTVSFTMKAGAPSTGVDRTVTRNGAVCIACQTPIKLSEVRKLAQEGQMGEVMTGVVAEGDRNRIFLSPTPADRLPAQNAQAPWKPQQRMPATAYLVSGRGYGITHWHQLFSERQLTTLTTFSDLIPKIRQLLKDEGASPEYAAAVITYLALGIGRTAAAHSKFAHWQNLGDFVAQVFTMQAIPMVWDFAEANPFSNSTQNWTAQVNWVAEALANSPTPVNPGKVYQADAATTIHANNGPVIVTDPPYYDNISYAELSDYFYVWLRPILQDVHPELFGTILVPTQEEMIANPRFEKSEQRFESLLLQSLKLIRQRCSPDYPSSIFYAYKQQEKQKEGTTSTGWETMLNALIQAGFQVTGTWPMRTERSGRPNSNNANALASSVILVCRPRESNLTATRTQFLNELAQELPPALAQLTQQSHIAPVDLAQAAIGPGMKVYTRYTQVTAYDGTPVTVRDALQAINETIAQYDHRETGSMDPETAFCIDWLKDPANHPGRYGNAETLALARNLVISNLTDTHRLITAHQGTVKLNPLTDYHGNQPYPKDNPASTWEHCHRMAYQLSYDGADPAAQGIEGAGEIARRNDCDADAVERLARILYNHYDRRDDSANAVIFNNLVTAFPEILKAAQAPAQGKLPAAQDQPDLI